MCYRPAEQRACYLRTMDPEDRETTQMMLSAAEQRVSDGQHGVPGQKWGLAQSPGMLTAHPAKDNAFWAALWFPQGSEEGCRQLPVLLRAHL